MMKSIIQASKLILLLNLCLVAGTLNAQNRPQPSADEVFTSLYKALDLNTEQQTEIKTLLDDHFANHTTNSNVSRETRMKEKEELDAAILELLDADQQKTFKSIQEEKRSNRKPPGKRNNYGTSF